MSEIIKLRKYQQKAVTAIEESLKTNNSCLLKMTTGYKPKRYRLLYIKYK